MNHQRLRDEQLIIFYKSYREILKTNETIKSWSNKNGFVGKSYINFVFYLDPWKRGRYKNSKDREIELALLYAKNPKNRQKFCINNNIESHRLTIATLHIDYTDRLKKLLPEYFEQESNEPQNTFTFIEVEPEFNPKQELEVIQSPKQELIKQPNNIEISISGLNVTLKPEFNAEKIPDLINYLRNL